jgi:CheY-like chemotaxis protein
MKHRFILLVDDDPDDQIIFIDTLNDIVPGVQCMTADNGKQALELLDSHQAVPSIIFLDLNMPFMNGFECLEQIQKRDKLSDSPVVIFTTSNSPLDQKRTQELGAKTFLTKTPDAAELKTKLLNILTMDL